MESEPERIAIDSEPGSPNGSDLGRLLLKLRARRTARRGEPEPQGTEELLNSLIGECRELMRDLADYAQYVAEPSDRTHLSTAAARIALIGARVGRAVGKLRSPAVANVQQQHYLVEHRQVRALSSTPSISPEGEGRQSKT